MKTEHKNTDNGHLGTGCACFPVNTLVGCRSKDVRKHLDLFSGIGGFALAAEWIGGFETIAFCEIERYPKRLLAQNFPGIPIFEDVRKLHAEDLPCKPDVITGGYPCQPFSVAGKQRGEADDRHLWPEMLRLIQECRPESVICENVAGHIKMGLDTVLTDLENEGFTCWTFIIPACGKGFPHKRDRVWIVANSIGAGWEEQHLSIEPSGQRQYSGALGGSRIFRGFTQSPVCRGNDGIPNRVDRIKGLGNAVVPQIAYELLRCI